VTTTRSGPSTDRISAPAPEANGVDGGEMQCLGRALFASGDGLCDEAATDQRTLPNHALDCVDHKHGPNHKLDQITVDHPISITSGSGSYSDG